MNGMSQRYRTLGELLTELKARLGFVAQGPASNSNNPVLLSMLQEGHEYVYSELNGTDMRKKTVITMERGSFLYDWHNDLEDEDINPQHVISVHAMRDGALTELTQGVSVAERADTKRGTAKRYDTLNGQIEIWPIPDESYGLLVEYIASPSRFTQMHDRPCVPDRLVLLYAIANAKAHYRHSDAQASAGTFANLLRLEKVRQKESKRYFVRKRGSSGTRGSGSRFVSNEG